MSGRSYSTPQMAQPMRRPRAMRKATGWRAAYRDGRWVEESPPTRSRKRGPAKASGKSRKKAAARRPSTRAKGAKKKAKKKAAKKSAKKASARKAAGR